MYNGSTFLPIVTKVVVHKQCFRWLNCFVLNVYIVVFEINVFMNLILTFNRRGDHISFEIERGATPLKPSYYLEAMEMYR
jgi:hypothetical protein